MESNQTKKTMRRWICLFIIMTSINLSAQDSLITVKFPQLIVKNRAVYDILDSVILAEKKCDYYSDSLIIGISGILKPFDSTRVFTFSPIFNINMVWSMNNRYLGFFKYKNHLCFYAGNYLEEQLFGKTDTFLTESFNWEKIKGEYFPSFDDTPVTSWVYTYKKNDRLIFSQAESEFNDCKTDTTLHFDRSNNNVETLKWDGDISKFIRIEIQHGPSSIKLLEEGLLCKYSNEKGKWNIDFFPIKKLDLKQFITIQNYLLNCSLLMKDTIMDEPSIETDGYGFSFFIIKGDYSNHLFWRDGECEELKTCINLINELIPKRKRKLYKIYPNP